MPSKEDYEQKILKLIDQRSEIDLEISRLQNVVATLAERDGVIATVKKSILDFDISSKELFPKTKLSKDEVDDTTPA